MDLNKRFETPQERRLRLIQEAQNDVGQGMQDVRGLTVLIYGAVRLDCSLTLDMTSREFRMNLSRGQDKLRRAWSSLGSEAGGFASHAIRAAASKGAKVYFGGMLPRKLPNAIRALFEEHAVDTRYAYRYDGQVPKSLNLQFEDGNPCVLVDDGSSLVGVDLPDDLFDVVLVDTASASNRRSLLMQLRRGITQRRGSTQVGIIANERWTAKDWRFLKDTNFRAFLSEQALRKATKRLFPREAGIDAVINLRLLKRHAGELNTTTMLGRGDVVWMNHVPYITQVSGIDLPAERSAGADETLATTATLSGATLACDSLCAKRGRMEAARLSAGQPLAKSFRVLDDQLSVQPSLRETRLPVVA